MEKLQYIFQWWQEFTLPHFFERNITIDLSAKMIPALIGPRRSGKSTLFFQKIKELRQSVPDENILYINYEDDRLHPLNGKELSELLPAYRQFTQTNPNYPVYLFLDEIQNVPNWERIIRRIHDTEKNVKLILTGSNSRMLGKDLSTALRGRVLPVTIYPLHFHEFLIFNSFPEFDPLRLKYSDIKNSLLRVCRDYLTFGGFPEVVLSEIKELKEQILKEYLRTIFIADIIERYMVRNILHIETLLKILLRQMGALYSVNKFDKILRTLGVKMSKNTIQQYIRYFEEAFLGKSVSIFSYSIKDQLQYPRKFYLIDNGLYYAVSFLKEEDLGRLLENTVYNHLHRKYEEVYYWKNPRGYEIDFVIPNLFKNPDELPLIQVCYDFKNTGTREREIRSLQNAMAYFKINRSLIITFDTWETIKYDQSTIHVIPFIEWSIRFLRNGSNRWIIYQE